MSDMLRAEHIDTSPATHIEGKSTEKKWHDIAISPFLVLKNIPLSDTGSMGWSEKMGICLIKSYGVSSFSILKPWL